MLTKRELVERIRGYELEEGTLECLEQSESDYPECLCDLSQAQYHSLAQGIINAAAGDARVIGAVLYKRAVLSYQADSPINRALHALADKYDWMSKDRMRKEVEKIVNRHDEEDKVHYAMFLAKTSVLLEAIIERE